MPPPNIQRDGDANLRIFWPVVPRKMDRSRRRWRRANISPISGGQGPHTMADGAELQVPSDDEMAPDLPQGSLSVRPPISLVDLSPESGHEG